MTTKVKVGKTTITVIIDSGADINYVNKKWCDKMQIPYKMTGWGWIKSYKGEKSRTKLTSKQGSKANFAEHDLLS
jgi:hypothetical protein